ncbi:MAG TPA: ABC transporter ATP-binding protein [Polyangiales bacterium]|nr:ABC transporter ATP-binding protein [Polyangiales bacterium]
MNDVANKGSPKAQPVEKPSGAPKAQAAKPAVAAAASEAEPTLRDLGLLKSLLPYLRPQWVLLGASLMLVPISTFGTLLQPYLLKHTVDAVLVQHDEALWRRMVMFYGFAVLTEFLAGFAESYCMQLAGQRSMADLRREVFRHAQRMRIRYYDKTPVGRVLTRVTNDVDSLSELFSSGAVMAVADLLTLLGIIVFMLYLDYRLSLITFLALPPLWLAIEVIRKRAREAFRDIRARIAELNAYLSEQVQGILVVQAYGRQAASAAEYRAINDDYRVANYRAIRLDALLFSIVESVSMCCVALVLFYASVRAGVIEGNAKQAAYIGTVVAFYQYIQQFFVPIRDLSTKYTIIQSALAAAERVFGFLSNQDVEQNENGHARGPAPDATQATIEFAHVDFSYRGDGDKVLSDVSFKVEAGEHVALVGATGAGKTTTVSLMLRLYEYDSGEIRVAGRDVRSYSRPELRRAFSVVPQDVFLFAGTVAQNVAFSPTDVDEARVRDVLRRVGALDLVERRAEGIHARVEERGGNFSAGERQLLAFARALYRDAPFMILDEATANIDSETEARLQAAVSELMRGRTAVVIAHRLSTIQKADRIVVFHHGQIVEQGTHQQLLDLGQVYAHLHRLQFGDTQEAV